MRCGTILQIVKPGTLYYQCNAGEEDTSIINVYKIAMGTKKEQTILDCTVDASVPAPNSPIITCK